MPGSSDTRGGRVGQAAAQAAFLLTDLRRIVNRRPARWITIWAGSGPWVVLAYRFDRAMFLLLGSAWSVGRIVFYPLFLLFRLLGAHTEIDSRAEIGPGLLIQHPSLGCVVSGKATVGSNLTLTGGNVIGIRKSVGPGELVLGNDVSLGANAVVLGPVRLGDGVRVGAGAVVTNDAGPGVVLVGVPARAIPHAVAREV